MSRKATTTPQFNAPSPLTSLAIFLVGCALTYWLLIGPLARSIAARSGWVTVPCRIFSGVMTIQGRHKPSAYTVWISSDMDVAPGTMRTSYRVTVEYDYEVGGKSYRGDRYEFMPEFGRWRTRGWIARVASIAGAKNPVCYVNPKDPTDAVLDPGFALEPFLVALPVFFVVFGGLGIVVAVFGRNRGFGGKSRREAHPTYE